jgi:TRAP-type C4-dicarboxylate transport system permease small subunit
LYLFCGGTAAAFLVLLLFLVVLQMASRWLDIGIPGLTTIAGYCMGASSFFALGYALRHGSHIRVSLIIGDLKESRRFAEVMAGGVSFVIASGLSFFAIKTTIVSYQLGEVSQGQDAIPIWMPQIAMCIGTVVLAIALLDNLFQALTGSSTQTSTQRTEAS